MRGLYLFLLITCLGCKQSLKESSYKPSTFLTKSEQDTLIVDIVSQVEKYTGKYLIENNGTENKIVYINREYYKDLSKAFTLDSYFISKYSRKHYFMIYKKESALFAIVYKPWVGTFNITNNIKSEINILFTRRAIDGINSLEDARNFFGEIVKNDTLTRESN